MKLRVVYLTSDDGTTHAFMFLVVDPGIEFQFTNDEALPLFECASDTAWVN